MVEREEDRPEECGDDHEQEPRLSAVERRSSQQHAQDRHALGENRGERDDTRD